MKVKKKLLIFVVMAAVAVPSAFALLDSGSINYNTGTLNGTIDFAVYESRDEYENAWVGLGLLAPGEGQYVYAYLITNDVSSTEVAHFALFGLTESNVSGGLEYQDQDNGGIESSACYLDTDEPKGVWEWSDTGGYSYVQATENSWLLVFSSNYTPVDGDYEIKGPEDSLVVPDVPEPSMIALFGAGGAFLMRRRKAAKKS